MLYASSQSLGGNWLSYYVDNDYTLFIESFDENENEKRVIHHEKITNEELDEIISHHCVYDLTKDLRFVLDTYLYYNTHLSPINTISDVIDGLLDDEENLEFNLSKIEYVQNYAETINVKLSDEQAQYIINKCNEFLNKGE